MEKLYVIIPAYNEGMNIEQCIDDWYPIVERHNGNGESRLVIINDGSKDNTYEIMQKLAKDKPLFTPLTKANGGHGDTVLYGYRYAIRHDADYIFQTDSDGQTDPAEFEEFWEAREKYDAVIGNRIERGDGNDANAPFRLMKASLVEKYINKLPEDFNIPNIMFTTYFVYYHEKVKFIPITFKPRQGGVNSINIKKIVKIGWKAVGDFHKLRREINDV